MRFVQTLVTSRQPSALILAINLEGSTLPQHEVAYSVNYSDSPNDEHPHGLEFRAVEAGGSVGSLLTRWFATEEDRRLFVEGDSLIDTLQITWLDQCSKGRPVH